MNHDGSGQLSKGAAGKGKASRFAVRRGVRPSALAVVLVVAPLAALVTVVLVLRHGLPLIWVVPAYGAVGAVLALGILAATWLLRRR